jgi:hypothetical protein
MDSIRPRASSPTIKDTPFSLVILLKPRKKSAEACLSPPSEAIGSMMTAATGLECFLFPRGCFFFFSYRTDPS